jgi:L-alanine-DL-glutamate epimerase-like enolase superfamily enzyme
VELAYRTVTLPLAAPFRISRSTDVEVELVWLELTIDGVTGYGEATPQDHYGESVGSATAFLEESRALLGDDPFALEEIGVRLAELPGEMAAKAALDAALHDLCGKLAGQPVWRLLGVPRTSPPTSFTIWLGDPEDMARRAEATAADGRFHRLKLKLGGRDGLDVERVRAVRAATSLPLQVDVNEYWTLDEALASIPELERLGVEYVEQPLPAGDPGGPELRRRSPLPIYLDEDCHTLADVPGCAERGHGVNIKLAKSGGIREAMRMVHAARALGLGVMIGCMVESGLAIAPACPVASLCDHVDLDGNLLLAEDPWVGVELVDGVQLPSERPGLGVVPRERAGDPVSRAPGVPLAKEASGRREGQYT